MRKTTYKKYVPIAFPTLQEFKDGIHRAALRVKEMRDIMRIARLEARGALIKVEEDDDI